MLRRHIMETTREAIQKGVWAVISPAERQRIAVQVALAQLEVLTEILEALQAPREGSTPEEVAAEIARARRGRQ